MSSTSSLTLLTSALLLVSRPVLAHIGIFHPSVYGFNASGTSPEQWFDAPVNTEFIKNPLRADADGLSFDKWWFHGLKGATPNAVMELPAGGRVMIEHSCSKAWTSYGLVPEQRAVVGDMPCDVNVVNGHATYGSPNVEASNGPMHVRDEAGAKGCGLAIAYTDDINSIKPEDFTVFSTNHTCVWKRETWFDIPADMPACPDGKKCICSWNWIHGTDQGEGYGNEIYMNGFDCTVTGAKSTVPLAKPKVPVSCIDDPSKCVKGAKQALYWQAAVKEGWNIADTGSFEKPMRPPFYNDEWGYSNGAQNDIFAKDGEEAEAAPAEHKQMAVENASSSSSATPSETSSSPSEVPTGHDRQTLGPVTTEVIVQTRTHVIVVTAEGPAPTAPAAKAKRFLRNHGNKGRMIRKRI